MTSAGGRGPHGTVPAGTTPSGTAPTTHAAVAGVCKAAWVPILVAACVLAAGAWVYLLVARGGYWRTDCRLPVGGEHAGPGAGEWPSVVAVIPARDEAGMLPETLPSLLWQE